MSRTIGLFTVEHETEITSSSHGGKTSQLLCGVIEISGELGTLIWLEVEGQEPQIIGRYSPVHHLFVPAREIQ